MANSLHSNHVSIRYKPTATYLLEMKKYKLYYTVLFVLLLSNTAANAQYISTFAGGMCGALGNGGPATLARMQTPSGVCLDKYGNVYIADQNDCRVRKVDTSGIITTVAGTGHCGYSGDGGPADSADLRSPEGVSVSNDGTIYIADYHNSAIRMVKDNIIHTIAGNGTMGDAGEGGPATDALLNTPADVAVDRYGNVYFVDQGVSKLKKVDTFGIITTIAGNGSAAFTGDGGPASAAQLNWPQGVGVDTCGNVYIADFYNSCVRKVDVVTGRISTIIGNDSLGYSGDWGPATDAVLYDASAVGLDHMGNVYVTDYYNYCIRKMDATGIITTIAGNDSLGFSGDGGPATDAKLSFPQGVAADDSGNIYIADLDNYRVRKVSNTPPPTKVQVLGSLPQIQIGPNPSAGKFFINTKNSIAGLKAVLYNSIGKTEREFSIVGAYTLDITGMQEGVYYLTFYTDEGNFKVTKKLVLIH